ncbi:hypothetical protein EON64_10560 [archaeon]|nr:MAG: hypothetical protein EON64_10560 [archaeon]
MPASCWYPSVLRLHSSLVENQDTAKGSKLSSSRSLALELLRLASVLRCATGGACDHPGRHLVTSSPLLRSRSWTCYTPCRACSAMWMASGASSSSFTTNGPLTPHVLSRNEGLWELPLPLQQGYRSAASYPLVAYGSLDFTEH